MKWWHKTEVLVDDKFRVTFPSRFKKHLPPEEKDSIVITRGIGKSLLAFSVSIWEKYAEKIASMNYDDPDFVRKSRYMLNWAAECSFDGQGRFRIPQELMDFAGIKREVVFFGRGDKVEIWDKDTYYRDLIEDENYDKNAENIFYKVEKEESPEKST